MAEGEGGNCAPKNVPPQQSSEYVVAAPTATAAFLDAPARKLARQLDFTCMLGHSQQLQQPQPQQQLSGMAQQPVAALPLPPQAPHSSVRVG